MLTEILLKTSKINTAAEIHGQLTIMPGNQALSIFSTVGSGTQPNVYSFMKG